MNMTVAQIIYYQLGGNKLEVMVGAENFVGSDKSLQFSFKLCRNANKCRITLTPADLYDIEFFMSSTKNIDCPKVQTFEAVYADQLTTIFKEFTGLDTSL